MTVFQPATVPFTSQEAQATLQEACRVAGLASGDARLIRLGENALFVLAAERVVVRIARNLDVLDDARKEVAVSTWLHEAGLPAARTTHHSQPLVVRDRPVTLWHFIDNGGGPATLTELAEVLRALHRMPVPEDLALPQMDILGRVLERISSTSILSAEERQFLLRKYQELRAAYEALHFPLPACAVHGDAHSDNLIKTTDGTIVLIDFERFAFGPPETDLAVTAIEHSLGWGTRAEYDQFAERYGFDVLGWEGYPVLRDINEFKMTTWLMQNVNEDEAIAREFRNRLFCLQNPDSPRQWRAF
ncbi:aminoglycoside phosphotransferase family protein [Actinomadura sp. ATCC 31491]|uniref:Aminoglycoside phosphotransferase family protein n=1 Tax=Actinomadura luzonensis TaxID=2805427 RepID=A0ABT0GCU5_9ACTN|nr:aminoglycoside phosphotransferase family protein [Actinomadura luzonensis]MCK2221926.1 aminoglycoside phosphotransferase family protein [Actinomadura luzonensis]